MPLPDDFPPPPYLHDGHPLSTVHFAGYDGNPVSLTYTKWSEADKDRPPDQCTLTTDIQGKMRARVGLSCIEMSEWKPQLRALLKITDGGTVSNDPGASCAIPPDPLITAGRHDSSFIKKMPIRLDMHR